jgi:hypothetical protein
MLLFKIDDLFPKSQQPHKLSPIQFNCKDFALKIFNLLDRNRNLFLPSFFSPVFMLIVTYERNVPGNPTRQECRPLRYQLLFTSSNHFSSLKKKQVWHVLCCLVMLFHVRSNMY